MNLPRLPDFNAWSFFKRLVLVLGATSIYVVLFLLLHPVVEAQLDLLALLPVIVASGLLGLRPGLISVVLAVLLNIWLHRLVGEAWSHLFSFGNQLNWLVLLIIGLVVGFLSDLLSGLREQSYTLTHEIDERRRAEERLRRQQLFIGKVMDTIPNFIFVKDRDGHYILANKAFASRHGMTPQEIQGKTDTDLYNEKDAATFLQDDREVMASLQEKFTPEVEVSDPQGNPQWLQVIKMPLILQGEVEQVIGIVTDITERKRIEQDLQTAKEAAENAREAAEAANIAKSDFVSLVSHELKSPITSVKLSAELLASGTPGPVNEMQVKLIKSISNNSERMTRLVSDLTDISRIEAGRLPLELSAVPLQEIVDEVTQSLGGQIEEKKQVLTLHIPDNLPVLWSDRARLVQILTNLVSNAHKYTPEGGEITISAACIDAQPQPKAVCVGVQDTGIGISPEDQRQLFEKFFRSDDQKARNVTGTGLGLSITKNLVELQNGRIWVESQLRQGSTFYFTVPTVNGRR